MNTLITIHILLKHVSYIHSSKQIHPLVAWQTTGVVNSDDDDDVTQHK